MVDATIWTRDGTGEKVVSYGGVIIEVTQMTFYHYRVTQQLKITYTQARTEPMSR